jgi:hypothetical protein
MKQTLFLISLFSILLISCQSESKPAIAKSDSSSVKESITYPFTPKYSINWRPGDEKNAVIVLNCLKHYIDGDMKGTFADMADTVDFYGDNFHFHGSKDSLQSIIGAERNELASVSKVFDTWLTAYYPDNGDTWVTLWYTEIMTDKKGKTDSLFYVDDVLLKDGKIKEYDEKVRHFEKPVPKK